MPYIKEEKREFLEEAIAQVVNSLRELESDDERNSMAGNLNYLFSSVINRVYSNPRYDDINEAVGVLECCKLELYRQVAVPYEDQKMFDNGSVYNKP